MNICWNKLALASVMEVKHGFAFPGKNIRDEPPGDILLTPGNFAIGGGFKGEKFKYFDGEVPADYVLSAGDLILTMTDLSKQADTLGYPAFVPKSRGSRFLHNQRLGKVLIKNSDKLDKRFLFYLLRTSEYRNEVLASATGTTVKHTSPGRILAYKACFPPAAEQKAIAAVLGALDDKIELNRRMNATLEAMARSLFQSWFVDAAQGGPPEGWSTRALYDCADYINGAAFRNEHFSAERKGLPVIKIGELKDGITAQTKFCETEREPKYRIISGDILFSWSGSPDTSIDIFIWTEGEGWLNQHIFKVQSKRPVEMFFVYYLLKHLKPVFIEIARDKQTTGLGHVTVQDLKRLRTFFPTDDVLQKFNRVVEPLFQKVYSNLRESRTLANLRDTLLPQLLSGELRVPS
jgi:type I restriction enzyme, S subunit